MESLPPRPTALFDLTREVAVVIGATGVLGGALAAGLAGAGANVAVLGRSRERGEACVQRILEGGGHAHFFTVDAGCADSLAAEHRQAAAALGTPVVLVNAVGGNDPDATVTPKRPFEQITADAWRSSFDLNLVGGMLRPCQEFGPARLTRVQGSIINVASVSAHLPLSRVVACSAAKAAVLNLTQFLARDWAPRGVRVNSLTPGFFPAEQIRRLLFQEEGMPTERARSILGHTPMARFGDGSELVGP